MVDLGEEQSGRAMGYFLRKKLYGVRETAGAKEIPRSPQGIPQLRCLAIVDKMPELAFPFPQGEAGGEEEGRPVVEM